MKHAGHWEDGKHAPIIELVETETGLFALYGWNGEKFTDCWKCIDQWTADPAEPRRLVAVPVYRFQAEGIDLESLEENSNEWENAVEIVDYDIHP